LGGHRSRVPAQHVCRETQDAVTLDPQLVLPSQVRPPRLNVDVRGAIDLDADAPFRPGRVQPSASAVRIAAFDLLRRPGVADAAGAA
jgi:hypothetical protein